MNATREQNSISRPSGGYPPMMEPASHLAAWQYVLPKREPVDHEERNDSGINSGSDCHSSSPGSDHSDNVLCSSPSISQMVRPILNYYSTPVMKMDQSSSMECHQYNNQPTHLYHNDHNLLSPPSSEPMASPNSLHGVTLSSSNAEVNREMNDQQTTLTPCASPDDEAASQTSSLPENNNDDPLKKLQMTFEKSSLLPSSPSPRHVEDSEEDKNKSVNAPTYYVQMVNSHGKVKKFKCKQCPFVCFVKADFWEHNKEHISIEKRLTCPKCPFVTEYKHHLEYHLRNHYGDKPYKCNQCSYDCVNKSMLNSHLKSHSKVYQYPCADCNYETKYCHSLKLHLRKYNHKPAMVRNPDGTPNPLPIIDVYGTRRGPKLKSQEQIPVEKRSPLPEAVPLPLNQFTPNLQFPFPAFPFFAGFPGALPNPLILQNLSQNLEKMLRENQSSSSAQEIQEETPQHMETGEEVLDLSKPEEPVQKSRRKGRAIKLAPEHNNLSDDEEIVTMFRNVEVAENTEPEASTSSGEGSSDHKEGESINNGENDYKCRYCNIYFGDSVLYTMHMGYHGYNNPFTCNMCGEVCADKISFFVHIARTSHS